MTFHSNDLRQHPLSAAFPAMPDADIEALADSIKKEGQRDDGVLYEGMVLDGWHRYLACQQAGVIFYAEEFTGDDPVAFVLAKNLHRRHLTASQRAACVVSATNWRPSGVTDSRVAAAATLTNKSLAEKAEVGERTIRDAKAAHTAGLGEEVREGRVSAERAAQIAKMPKSKRAKALTEPAKPRVVSAEPKFEKLYGELKAELVETKEALGEMRDLAASAKAFEDKAEFKEMQVLRLEIKSCKRRRDELMRENGELKKEVARWRKKAEAK